MMDLNKILDERTPYRPRQRSDLPLLEWAKNFKNYGMLVLPIYISSKKEENPEGFKWSTTKMKLINGHSSMNLQERNIVQEAFRGAFYTLTESNEGRKEALIVQFEHLQLLRKRGYAMKPLVEAVQIPDTKEPIVEPEMKEKPVKKGRFGRDITK